MLQASHESPVKNASGYGMDDQDLIPRRAKGFLQHVLLTSWAQRASHSIGYVNSSLLYHETHLHERKPLSQPPRTVTLATLTVKPVCL
jgi:hypothetical protein